MSSAFSPFNLEDDRDYQRWREWKLEYARRNDWASPVSIVDPNYISEQEVTELISKCSQFNTVLYQFRVEPQDTRQALRGMGQKLGLEQLDGNLCSEEDDISALQVREAGSRQQGYIPYTDKSLNWHTDGYYNPLDRQIRAMLLHCECDAESGGENQIFDHELLYILLRDHNKDCIRALMQPDAMIIPANFEDGKKIRDEQPGPVFSIMPVSGTLHMRYTARKRNIAWKQDKDTRAAVSFIEDLFEQGCEYIHELRLAPGQGLLSNNALHNRTSFVDNEAAGKKRLIYRARYYNRVRGTELYDLFQ